MKGLAPTLKILTGCNVNLVDGSPWTREAGGSNPLTLSRAGTLTDLARSSVGKSVGLLNRRSRVRFPSRKLEF